MKLPSKTLRRKGVRKLPAAPKIKAGKTQIKLPRVKKPKMPKLF